MSGLSPSPFFLTWAITAFIVPTAQDAQVTLNPSGASVSLGKQFNFTLVSTVPVTSGTILFRKGNPSVTLCVWDMSTQTVTRKEPGYGCGTTGVANSYYFEILSVTRNDSGTWNAQYGLMTTNNSSLDVRFPPTVEIKPVSPCVSPTYVDGKKDVSLNCTVTSANPVPSTFKWYHKNQLVGEGQIYTISTVTRSSRGQYNCTAENGEAPHGEATIKVRVHYPPIVTVPTETQIVNESSDLDIPCTADAKPNATSIVWTRDGVGVILPETGGVLHLKNLKRSDSGTYTCTASNTVKSCERGTKINNSTAKVNVEVQYKPNITSFGIFNKEQQRRVTVAEGDKVIFLCQADSFPPPDMTISNNSAIKNQTQQHISVSYTLGSADCYDRGNYTCSARNILGEVLSDNTELLVKCSPRPLNPESSRLIVAADLDEDADFQFDVIAHPKPNFSLKSTKGTQLDYDVNIVWDGLVASGTFTLHTVKREQFGSYILTANNSEGSLNFSVTIQAKSSPEEPTNLRVTDVSTQSLSIAWEEGFNGGAEQNFTVEYRRTDGQWIIHPDVLSEGDILELVIGGLDPNTRYEIQLKAQNQYGSSEYIYVSERTNSEVNYGLYAAVGSVAIFGVIVVVIVVVVLKTKRKKGGNKREQLRNESGGDDDDDVIIMDNTLYETSDDLQLNTSGGNAGDVYAVVQKPTKKTPTETAEDAYSLPQKDKTNTKDADQKPEEIYANTGENAVEVNAAPKVGRDEDGLMYVSVDFENQTFPDTIIGADQGNGEYTSIDFKASAKQQDT